MIAAAGRSRHAFLLRYAVILTELPGSLPPPIAFHVPDALFLELPLLIETKVLGLFTDFSAGSPSGVGGRMGRDSEVKRQAK